jgi:hypothetical protein
VFLHFSNRELLLDTNNTSTIQSESAFVQRTLMRMHKEFVVNATGNQDDNVSALIQLYMCVHIVPASGTIWFPGTSPRHIPHHPIPWSACYFSTVLSHHSVLSARAVSSPLRRGPRGRRQQEGVAGPRTYVHAALRRPGAPASSCNCAPMALASSTIHLIVWHV